MILAPLRWLALRRIPELVAWARRCCQSGLTFHSRHGRQRRAPSNYALGGPGRRRRKIVVKPPSGLDPRQRATSSDRTRSEGLTGHEPLRLLYVTATRASDHLVESVHRKDVAPLASYRGPGNHMTTAGTLSWWNPWRQRCPSTRTRRGRRPLPWNWGLESAVVGVDRGERGRAGAMASLALRPVLVPPAGSPSGPRPAAGSAGRCLERPEGHRPPPGQKGRYGSDIGRAGHGVLQTVDLADRRQTR